MLSEASCYRSRRFYFEASPRISRLLALFTCGAVSGDSYCSTLTLAMDARFRTAVLLFVGLSWACDSPASGCRPQIPPHDQVARVARFVAHQCDWASMATISTHKPVVGQPFANVFSVSDGAPGTSSGVPYMYLTRMEISVQDLLVRIPNSVPDMLYVWFKFYYIAPGRNDLFLLIYKVLGKDFSKSCNSGRFTKRLQYFCKCAIYKQEA